MKLNLNISALTLAFIVLKLTHVINWSWFWVLAPSWIPLVIGLSAIAFLVLFALISNKKVTITKRK